MAKRSLRKSHPARTAQASDTFSERFRNLIPGTISREQACVVDVLEKLRGLRFSFRPSTRVQGNESIIDPRNGAVVTLDRQHDSIGVLDSRDTIVVNPLRGREREGLVPKTLGEHDKHVTFMYHGNDMSRPSEIVDGQASEAPNRRPPTDEHWQIHNETRKCYLPQAARPGPKTAGLSESGGADGAADARQAEQIVAQLMEVHRHWQMHGAATHGKRHVGPSFLARRAPGQ